MSETKQARDSQFKEQGDGSTLFCRGKLEEEWTELHHLERARLASQQYPTVELVNAL